MVYTARNFHARLVILSRALRYFSRPPVSGIHRRDTSSCALVNQGFTGTVPTLRDNRRADIKRRPVVTVIRVDSRMDKYLR